MNKNYSEYSANYISGCMSLRPPQKRSLKILDTILDELDLKKEQDLECALEVVHDLFPTCINFERDFMSLTFALATGVGKTRLMGAFITYLYTQKGIKNFFVVAPNLTIYNKLMKDLGDPSSDKYVFRGIGCFSQLPPNLITGENYRERGFMGGFSDVTINIFNISKFNREIGTIRNLSEYLGKSYFDYLASQKDLVVIMDESHHYRADRGMAAINELKPVLGLELTATPQVEQGTKTVKFKNVVYEYPLSSAIKDGYAKIPYAMTRRDIADYNLSKDEIDKMMLTDGIMNHERVKERLKDYAINNGTRPVKPFVLVVCQNTDHAESVLEFISSPDFFDGKYASKTIIVHSNQRGAEREENVQKLLDVENYDNPVEIVIHVNILKEGWDVNNLYTIIPLRTAASQTLREQTIGRGLRLPYGQRTGVQDVDALVITAHDKFEDIIREAANPNSLLKAGNVIFADEIEKAESIAVSSNAKINIQGSLFDLGLTLESSEDLTQEERNAIVDAVQIASKQLIDTYRIVGRDNLSSVDTKTIVDNVVESVDLAEIVKKRTDFEDIIRRFTGEEVDKQRKIIETGTMAIPQIKVTRDLKTDYHFEAFELDLTVFNYYPISNEILLQNLVNSNDSSVVAGKGLDFNALNPMRVIVDEISKKPEIDYDECSDLLYDLLTSLFNHLAWKFTSDEIKNIVMFNKKDIANKIYAQMKEHFVCSTPDIVEQVCGVSYDIVEPSYMRKIGEEPVSIFEPIEDSQVPKVLFNGFQKALHPIYKFDSAPERRFAIVCESDPLVLKWLRPAPKQFNLFYDGNRRYEPDFVVETEDMMYLVEVKGEDRINDEDNLAKKARAVRYCQVANVYCEGHGLKNWKYLYIPSQQIQTTSSFNMLVQRFEVKE